MPGFDDYANATKFRDLVTRIAEGVVDSLRPRVQYATVQSINTTTRKATVRYTGETVNVELPYGSIVPVVGQVVRVDGPRGDRFIADVIGAAGQVSASNGFVVGDVKFTAKGTLESGWLWCDGTYYERTAQAALFAAIGVQFGNTSGTNFRVPDMRGRFPIGAGSGTGLTGRVLGNSGGSESHTLTNAQMPVHSHGGGTNWMSADHAHGFTTNNGGSHTHHARTVNLEFWGHDAQGWAGGNNHNGFQTTDRTGVLTYTGSITTDGDHNHTGTTGGVTANHTHAISNDGGGSSFPIMPPWTALNYIIKAT